MMKRPKGKHVAAAVAFLLLLLVSSNVSYENGKLVGTIETQDYQFQTSVDLVPVVHEVVRDNRILHAIVDNLHLQVEYRDGVIDDQRKVMEEQTEVIADQIGMINAKNDYINELENRPPEIVEVVKVVEKIVYVEVPRYPEPPPPIEPPVIDNDGDHGGDDPIVKPDPEPEPEPEPEPPDDGGWDSRHDGKHHHKDHGDPHEGKHERRK